MICLFVTQAHGSEYLVGPGDVLNITVYDNDDLETMPWFDGRNIVRIAAQSSMFHLAGTAIG